MFFGGAAGGGKSDGLLMGALQYVDVPRYNALILRRTTTDLELPDAIQDRAAQWLEGTDAHWQARQRTWRFPSGARLTFGYCASMAHAQRYRSAQFQYIGFDESTQFEERIVRFLFSRLRRPALPCALCRKPVEFRDGRWGHRRTDIDVDHHAVPNEQALDALGRANDGLSILDVPLRMRLASNPGDIGHAWHLDRKSVV